MQKEEKKTGFDINYTIKCLEVVNELIKKEGQVPFDEFCEVLDQFCFVFK